MLNYWKSLRRTLETGPVVCQSLVRGLGESGTRNSMFFGIGASVVAIACVAAAAASRPTRESEDIAAAATLDRSRAADRQLQQFGAAHPQCALWSNWQKLCSRTGRNGSVRCTIDPGRPVEPSAPFCQVGFESRPRAGQPSPDEISSSERYCTARGDLHSWSPRTGTRSRPVCTRHAPGRPFNGRRLAALDHPACQSWVDRDTRATVCTRAGAGDIPSCATLSASRYEHPRLLVCSRWSAAMTCESPHPTLRQRDPNAEAWIDDPVAPDGAAVNGPFCEE